MAGPDPDGAFDPDDFRQAMRRTMLMGLPEDATLRPTFYFPSPKTHTSTDPTGRPWAMTTSVPAGAAPPAPVQVLCSIEVDAGDTGYTTAGRFEAREATLGFFEDEWAQIADFEYVKIGGRRYDRLFEHEPNGLFEVTFRQVQVKAKDS